MRVTTILYIYTDMKRSTITRDQDNGQQMSLLAVPPPVRQPATRTKGATVIGNGPVAMSAAPKGLLDPASIHPSLWRASQLARPVGRVVASGIAALDAELPGGGWAEGCVAELIVKQPGIGELSILRGALDVVAKRNRPIWLVGCPFAPNAPEFTRLGLAKHVRWVKTESPADAQWACETILRSSALGALVAWLPRARPESIRRLQGLAAATDAMVFDIRPQSAANDASASPLRLALEPAPGGFVRAHILKRRGPVSAGVLLLQLKSLGHLSGISGARHGPSDAKPKTVQNIKRGSGVIAVGEMFGADV